MGDHLQIFKQFVVWLSIYGTDKSVVQKIRVHQSDSSTDAYFDINVVDIAEATKGPNFKE